MDDTNLYIIGTRHIYGDLLIYESKDYGFNWSKATILKKGKFHSASGNILIKNNIIYKAVEKYGGGKWGNFDAIALSINKNDSLMNAENWNFTKPLNNNGKFSWLEGNMISDTKNNVVNILRTHFAGPDKAIILTLKNNQLIASNKLIDMPGGGSKFTIRYDSQLKKYYSIVNKQTKPEAYRNNLVLISSINLIDWKIESKLLNNSDSKNYAWQYIDWQFEDNDIVFISRTAINNNLYKAKSAHDSNLLSFHRIHNFRETNENTNVLLECGLLEIAQ